MMEEIGKWMTIIGFIICMNGIFIMLFAYTWE